MESSNPIYKEMQLKLAGPVLIQAVFMSVTTFGHEKIISPYLTCTKLLKVLDSTALANINLQYMVSHYFPN